MKKSVPAESPDAYVEPRLRPGGKYEMASVELRDGMTITPATVRSLVAEAMKLNERIGDPTKAAGSA